MLLLMDDIKGSSQEVPLFVNTSALVKVPCFVFYLSVIFTLNLTILTFPLNQTTKAQSFLAYRLYIFVGNRT
jgi:hypothetical protein